jgi:uncharacterized protein (DUF433 family)
MADTTRFTPAEVAFLLHESVRAVTKALDRGPVRPVLQARPGASIRMIDWADLFYLFAVKALREDLTPRARAEFYEAVRRARIEQTDEVRFGRFRVAVADIVDEVKKRVAELAELRNKVMFAPDGKAVLDSRGVAVHRIAALLNGGLSVNAVLEEYPSLSREAVETAYFYAHIWPKPGRPYPRTTANRAMRDDGSAEPDELPFDEDG